MIIYKAGTKYFSTYRGAKIYREKFFNSSRQIDVIYVEDQKVSDEDIVARVQWRKDFGGIFVSSYWCIGMLPDLLKDRDFCPNVLEILRSDEDTASLRATMTFKNMGVAKYRIRSKKLLKFLDSEISKAPIGEEIQIKI